MILIDYPYVSEFLLNTIKKNNYEIVSTKSARELLKDESLAWISEEKAVKRVKEQADTALYSNSENALGWLAQHLGDSTLSKQAQLFKDKARFRELIKESYPDFQFKTVLLEEIQYLDEGELTFPFVIKPSVGFFSIGVHVVKNQADWHHAKKELNYENLKSIYPPEVLNTSSFIIEEYIQGEEYAIDCYFDKDGEVVILNILHHKFSSGSDTSDRVYSTSKEIVLKFKSNFAEKLHSIGLKSGLRNFPAHVEVRVDSKGRIIPIEINPLRFGGWCTTADLLGVAIGYNPYEYFLRNLKPDWEQVFEGKEEQLFSIIVLNNNSGLAPAKIDDFDYELLSADFENTLLIRKMDVGKYSIFGFLFVETSPGNEAELSKILLADLKKYITTS
ncbi:MAG: ATP-grasp domain-containing protein [Bacteroidetes bacterium]|nr:MAG: ATP-grasp domain-containing protein [Bacteroidota bacterium]